MANGGSASHYPAQTVKEKIDQFVELMLPLGLVEVSRTGVVAIRRGAEGM